MQRRVKIAISLAVFVVLVLLGAVIFATLDSDMGAVDAIYLSATTATTVGYGNVSPRNDGAKIFASIYQLLPVGLFFYTVSLFE